MTLRLSGCNVAESLDEGPKRFHSWCAQRCEGGIGVSILRRTDLHQSEVVATMGLMSGAFLPGKELPLAPMLDAICRDLDFYLAVKP